MQRRGRGSETRYAAFLSYSHKDAGVARWLHRRLESYRIPRRLAGTEGERGPVSERLTPIFRDREELPAGHDLSQKVRAALSASENLIIICSPASAASPWVQREIAAFRELCPERPVLAAIVAGEPPSCFPPGLATGGSEPLAADLRAEADGRRLGLLKLVAGLSGVGLDALVQRDAQRRIRRVTAVTGVAVAALVAMAALTVMALEARREAQRQRAEAEGLVEFMLTDLRDRLRSVGRLDALAAVNQRALRYYAARSDLDELPDDSLGRRARIFHSMGDDNLEADDPAAALAAFRQADRTTAEQLARAPANPERLVEHARSLGGIGRVHEVRGEWDRARHHFSALSKVTDRLLAAAPQNPEYLGRAALAAIDLGNVHLRGTKDYAAAQGFYDRAIGLLQLAERSRPHDKHVLLTKANALGGRADSLYYRELWQASLATRLKQYSIVTSLRRAHPNDRDIHFFLAAAHRGLAYSLLKVGQRSSAQSHLLAAYETVRELVRLDPTNAKWGALESKLSVDFREIGVRAAPAVSGAPELHEKVSERRSVQH